MDQAHNFNEFKEKLGINKNVNALAFDVAQYSELKRQHDASEAGAAIAHVFASHDWLASFDLMFVTRESIYKGLSEHIKITRMGLLLPEGSTKSNWCIEMPIYARAESMVKMLTAARVIRNLFPEIVHELDPKNSERFFKRKISLSFNRFQIDKLVKRDGHVPGTTLFAALFKGTCLEDLILPEWSAAAFSDTQSQ